MIKQIVLLVYGLQLYVINGLIHTKELYDWAFLLELEWLLVQSLAINSFIILLKCTTSKWVWVVSTWICVSRVHIGPMLLVPNAN